MSKATEFYNSLVKMTYKELEEYEDAINNDTRILTERYLKALRDKVNSDIIKKISSEHEESFLDLLVIRSYMFDHDLNIHERFVSQYMICIEEEKNRLGVL
jgi:hypothetical protein